MRNWAQDLAELHASTEQLLGSLDALSDTDVSSPSLLPGWTRGHVLAHIEGNARGLDRLVRWAIDGIERPMYISREVRGADVELDASRRADHHREAVTASAHDIAVHMAALPADRFDVTVVLGNGLQKKAGELALHRLQEVCVHHADLGLPTYTYRDWPTLMCEGMLANVTGDFAARGEFPVNWVQTDVRIPILSAEGPGVIATPQAALAWLLGRHPDENDLQVVDLASVPEAPTWR